MTAGYNSLQQEDNTNMLPAINGICYRKRSRFKVAAALFVFILTVAFIIIARPALGPNKTKHEFVMTKSNSISDSKKLIDEVMVVPEVDRIQPVDRGELKQRVPQVLIIGVKKAGTGALVQYLNLHPDIKVAVGEQNFFDYEDNFNRGLDYYRSFMPFTYKDQITVEKTSNYFHNKGTEFRIHSTNSSMKLLLIIREPITRAVSDYLQRKRKGSPDVLKFEDLAIKRKNGEVNSGYAGIRPSHYYQHMSRWLQVFPFKQFHIIDSDDLVRSPYQEVYKIETFLGLPHRVSSDRFVFNKTKGFYCLSLDTSDGGRTEKCLSKGKGRKHPEVNPVVLAKLIEYFRPLNEKFFELIGRKFNWR